jgi:hypothetical protein
MRHIRIAVGLTAATGALCVAVTPALAENTNFVANIPHKTISAEHTARASGKTEEEQVFKFQNVVIKCKQFPFPERYSVGNTAVTSSVLSSEAPTELEVGVHFEKCGRILSANSEEFVPANFKGKVTIVYHINGFAKLEGNGEGEENEFGKEPHATFRETSATFTVAPAKLCKVIIPEQSVPLRAETNEDGKFTAFVPSNAFTPTGRKGFVNNEKESLVISHEFKGLLFRYAEETQCNIDQPHEEGSDGTYKGVLNLAIPAGNLGVEE